MFAMTKLLAGGAALAALASAVPAAAQYYPGYGYGSPYGGNVVGQVLNDVLGGGYGYGGYGPNSQVVINECASAAQARLGGSSVYNGSGYGGGRVLGISHVDPHPDGGITVRGVASSGRYAAYGYGGSGAQSPVDLTWRCRTDARGFIRELTVNGAEYNNGYNGGYGSGYAPGNYDYSQYGYRRY
jgi:hypothetical protein